MIFALLSLLKNLHHSFSRSHLIYLNSLFHLSVKHVIIPTTRMLESAYEHLSEHVCMCVPYGRRDDAVFQSHCAGSVSTALTHIHQLHINSSLLSLTQTLRNVAVLLCSRMFHFSLGVKQPMRIQHASEG